MIIKIIDLNKPELMEQAKGELEGAGYILSKVDEVSFLGVDAVKHGDGEQTYTYAAVIVGKKN